MFSLGRELLYTVFMVFSLPQTLVKTLAKNLVKNLTKNMVKNLGGLFGTLKRLIGGGRRLSLFNKPLTKA